MFVAGVVVVLYFTPYFTALGPIGDSLIVSDIGVSLAILTFVSGFVSYLWAPKSHVNRYSLAMYFLLLATAGVLVVSTGNTGSPFVALWILVAFFAAVFGVYGAAPTFGIALGYYVYLYLSSGFITSQFIVVLTAGIAPVIAGVFIWHGKSKKEEGNDQAYRQLATELSNVSTKSDVVINAIGDGVIAIDSKNHVDLINPAAQRILGWGKTDALTLDYQSVLKLTDKNDKPLQNSTDPIQLVLAGNREMESDDLLATTESGKKLMLSMIVSPIGQPGEGVIVVFRDVTAERKGEREQAEFISTASHEMRTPVASIEGYLGLALNPNTAQIDEKARDFIGKAHDSAQHLGRLFQDLLDVSKAEDGRLSNNPSVVDVIDFTGDMVEGLRPKAEQKQLRLFYKPNPEDDHDNRALSPVYYATVDNDHLREVLSNLIENAIKYTPNGDVVVDVTGDDEHVKISVTDSGIGIPAEDVSHLFQKFYRVDNSQTREIGGTGLGLYLCRRLVEVMEGRIWVESEFQKGSTFYVELPRTSREEAMHALETTTSDEQPEKSPLPVAADPVYETEQPAQPVAVTPPQPTQPTTSVPSPQTAAQTPPTLPATQPSSMPPTQPQQQVQANTPLSQIEQNPAAYTRRPSVQIPVRRDDTNQTPR